MFRLGVRGWLGVVSFVLYLLVSLVLSVVRAFGSPSTAAARTTRADAEEQRSIHRDWDRLTAIDTCLVQHRDIVAAVAAFDRVAVDSSGSWSSVRIPMTRVSCSEVGIGMPSPPWSDVRAAGARLDRAARRAEDAMTAVQRREREGGPALEGALAEYDTAASELLHARADLEARADEHALEVDRRIEARLRRDPARAADVAVLHVIDAGLGVNPLFRVERPDLADVAGVEHALVPLEAAIAALPAGRADELRQSGLALAATLHVLKSASGEARAQALDATRLAVNRFVEASNRAGPRI